MQGRPPPRHSILLKANHNMLSKVLSMLTYYRCGKVTDTHNSRVSIIFLHPYIAYGIVRRGCVEGKSPTRLKTLANHKEYCLKVTVTGRKYSPCSDCHLIPPVSVLTRYAFSDRQVNIHYDFFKWRTHRGKALLQPLMMRMVIGTVFTPVV